MLELFHTLSLRYLRRHWGRAALVVLSIGLGVAAWVATNALQGAMHKSIEEAATPLRGLADFHVSNSNSVYLDAALGDELMKRLPHLLDRVEPLILEEVTVSRTNQPPPARKDKEKKEKPDRVQAVLIGMRQPDPAERDKLAKRDIELLDVDPLAYAEALFFGHTPVVVGEGLDDAYLKGEKNLFLWSGGKPHPAVRVGRLRASGAVASLGGFVLLTEWQAVAKLVNKPDMVQRLDVTLKEGVKPAEALAEVRAVVKGRAEVETARQQDRRIREVLKGIEIGFKLCGAGALVVGLFLVYNALSVSVAERRHDIGILRSVGATRSQVRLLFLGEALVLGAAGTTLGLPLGLGIAKLALGPIREAIRGLFMSLQPREIELDPVMLLTAALGGMATALLAALVPASQAAAEEPADAVRRAPPRVSAAYRLLRVGGSLALVVPGALLMAFKEHLSSLLLLKVGGGMLAVGVPLALVGWRRLGTSGEAAARSHEAGHSEWGLFLGGMFVALAGAALVLLRDALPGEKGTYLALSMVIVGALLLIPSLAAFATRLVQPLARAVLPVEGRLAADNLVRSPGRTGLVIAAVAAGVALTVQTAGVIRSNEDAFLGWLDDTLRADLYVQTGGLTSGTGHQKTMSKDMAAGLFGPDRLPDESLLVGRAWRFPNYGVPTRAPNGGLDPAAATAEDGEVGTRVFMVLLDAAKYCEANRERANGHSNLEPWRLLAREPSGALVSENFARMHGVAPGDWLELPGLEGTVRCKVLATVVDYNWIRGTIFLDRQHNLRAMGAEGVNEWEVYLPAGADAKEIAERLSKSEVGALHSLVVVTREQVRTNYKHMVRTLYGLAYTQELVVGVVAVLGVVLSLLISVLSRQRELGLLRAVGGTRGQVVYTVLAEGVLIGFVGTVLGIMIGLPLEWYVVRVILFEEAGFLFPVQIPWLEVGVISLLSIGLATVASLLPAMHAMRMNVTEAVACE